MKERKENKQTSCHSDNNVWTRKRREMTANKRKRISMELRARKWEKEAEQDSKINVQKRTEIYFFLGGFGIHCDSSLTACINNLGEAF